MPQKSPRSHKSGTVSVLSKGCSFGFLLFKYGALLISGIILLVFGFWLLKTTFVRKDAIYTGRFITDEKSKTKQTTYELEYIVNDRVYRQFQQIDHVPKTGEKIPIYADTKKPVIVFTTDPNKLSRICFLISVVLLSIFFLMLVLSYTYPKFFCGASILGQIFHWSS